MGSRELRWDARGEEGVTWGTVLAHEVDAGIGRPGGPVPAGTGIPPDRLQERLQAGRTVEIESVVAALRARSEGAVAEGNAVAATTGFEAGEA